MVTIQTTNMIMLHYIHCFTSFAYTTANYRLIYVLGDDIRTPDVILFKRGGGHFEKYFLNDEARVGNSGSFDNFFSMII